MSDTDVTGHKVLFHFTFLWYLIYKKWGTELSLLSLFLFFSVCFCIFTVQGRKCDSSSCLISSYLLLISLYLLLLFPAALHADSPKPHWTALQLVGVSFPLRNDVESVCWTDVLSVVRGCSFPWMQLCLWRKKNPRPSVQSTLKGSGRFDLIPEISALSIQKKKLAPQARPVDPLWPWAFHQLLEYVVVITCTLSALSPGLCLGRTIHHNHIILYRLLLGGMRLLELVLPLTGADSSGGLQMGSAKRWCSASASSAFSRQNLRSLRRESDLCSFPSRRTRQWAHPICIPSGVSYQLPTSAQGVGWYWAGAGNARSEVANCLMHDVITVLVIAVVQN